MTTTRIGSVSTLVLVPTLVAGAVLGAVLASSWRLCTEEAVLRQELRSQREALAGPGAPVRFTKRPRCTATGSGADRH
jgi:hypothetical protein